MQTISVIIKNISDNPLPEYATSGSSGLDVKAFLDEPLTLKSLERMAVPTGLFVEIPAGYEIQIRPRSGLALREGITCLNTPGTIDADYRGEIKILLINLSQQEQTIQPGDRIAQMVLQKVEKISWKEEDSISATERNTGGFGHTGKN